MSEELEYAYPDWREDICELLRLAQTSGQSTSSYREAGNRYFANRYADESLRHDRKLRVTAALQWLQSNSSEIASRAPKYLILGDGEMQVEDRVYLVLFAIFQRCPVDRLNESFPADILLDRLE